MENYYRRKAQVERILQLAEQNATGTPDELAARLGISKRTLLRIISCLRENGTPIVFCKKNLTYKFTPPHKYAV